MTRYAETTTVTIAKTKQEIEATLARYGADQFASGWDQVKATVAFRMNGRYIRYTLAMPNKEDFRLTPKGTYKRNPEEMTTFWEQACRQRWRALLLVLKAKLEAVAAGITSLEDEFLSATLLPSGATVGEWAKDQIDQVYLEGKMPPLLGSGR